MRQKMKARKTPNPIATFDAPAAIGPYSQGVTIGNLLFISGQLPIDPSTGEFVEGGIREKTHQVIKNLEAIVKAANSDLSQVIKTTLFLMDMDSYSDVNEVYAQYFEKSLPARAVVQVAGLPRNSEIEMEAIVYLASIQMEGGDEEKKS
jgi:2-iminobutanoate/2-iminopropanoate deaminase